MVSFVLQSLSSGLGDIMSESETRAGIRKHRVRPVYYQPALYCTSCEGTNTQTKRHKSHNHQKAIYELQKKRRQRKTNLSSTGGRERADKSAES